MKLGKRLLATAKKISLWWGIYLILGCCAGFMVKTLRSFLMITSGEFVVTLYLPIMAAASLVLGTVSYFISAAVKRVPVRKLQKEMLKIFRAEGLSDRLMQELSANAVGELKNSVLITASMLYCLRGETEKASDTLNKTDVVSVLDVAQSTGDLRTAAYYYCAKMIVSVLTHNKEDAVRAYDEGIYYLESLESNDIILTVLAIYQTEASLYNYAADTIKKIKWRSLPPYLKKYGKSLSAAILAVNLVNMGDGEKAVFYANISLENPCSDYMREFAEDIIRRARAAKRDAQNNDF